MSLDKK